MGMPTYIFQHPKTKEYKEVFQKMNDQHCFTSEDGTEWDRVFTSPNMSVNDNLISADTTCEDFARKTADKNYNLGEMWDLSAELSEKRAQTAGQDHVKEKAKQKYSKKCKGKTHPHARKSFN